MTLEAIADELARLLKDRWDQQLVGVNETHAALVQLEEWKRTRTNNTDEPFGGHGCGDPNCEICV